MCHLEGSILFLTDYNPSSVVQSLHHTEFLIKWVVRGNVKVLISVGPFSADGDFQGAVWLSQRVNVQKGCAPSSSPSVVNWMSGSRLFR